MNITPFKRPGAFAPVIMSLAALALLLAHVARYGVVRGRILVYLVQAV